jgi:hypothetical protein
MVETKVLENFSVCGVQVSPDMSSIALATLDGHFGVWEIASIEAETKKNEFVWFAESGERITNVQFCSDGRQCAVVCWNGGGAVFEKQEENRWVEKRGFSPSAVFVRNDGALGPPAFSVWSTEMLHVLFNGGIKSYAVKENVELGFNVNWVNKGAEVEYFGFCAISPSKSVVIDQNGLLSLVELGLK